MNPQIFRCCSYHLKGHTTMKLILNSWETLVETLILFILTFIHKGKETESNSSTCGSIQPKISTSTLLYGTHNASCKILNVHFQHIWILINLYDNITSFACIFSFLVDNIPIRVYENDESVGVPFPKNQPMKLYSSLWNADQWATRGGLVKTDWSKAPFTAYYRNFNANACFLSTSSGLSSCGSKNSDNLMRSHDWRTQELDANGRRMLRWVQRYFMIYNYCADVKRFPQGRPRECRRFRFF